ncbi:MAG: helix-turn-helix domain-containing protein, partial [Dehalococcoidia bacterium]
MQHPEAPRGEPLEDLCPHYCRAMTLLGKRWTGLILRVLDGRPGRFGEITASIEGLSDRMLSTRLRELEQAGLVHRIVHAEVPVRVEYRLSAMG